MPATAHSASPGAFERFVEHAPDAIVGIGGDGQIMLVNAQTEVLFGYSREELMGRSVEVLVPGRFQAVHPRHRDRYLGDPRTRPMGAGLELFGRRKDGTEFPAEISLSGGGATAGVQAIAAIRDISDRHAAEQARSYLAAIVDSSDDAIAGKTLDGTIVSWNQGAERHFGYTSEEIVGRDCRVLVAPDRVAEVDAMLAAVARGEVVEHHETWLVRKDGARRPVELSMSPLRGEGGQIVGAATIARDVSERVEAQREQEALRAELEESRRQEALHEKAALEAQLNQLRRLESVGQLAGGIAHDFNNILGVILNYADFVSDELEEGSAVQQDVEEIRRAAERAAALTRQLLIFSRRDVVHPQLVDLNVLVADLDRLLRRALGEHVQMTTSFSEREAVVEADPGQLEQVLVNLAVNARDAMPGGGRLLLQTAIVTLDEASSDLPPGEYVRLNVSDTGAGMPSEVASRAFEPFFSTKAKGDGTGLGLTTVYGIVTEAGGEIRIYSEPGLGTTVKVHLPARAGAPAGLVEERSRRRSQGRGETVLLVEDEPDLRRLTERILRGGGYEVLTAPGPEAALELCEQRPVDLLLTDVVMPGMLGPELAERAVAARPGLPVLFMSGYVHQAAAQLGMANPEEMDLVEKPFTAEMVLNRVRRALDGGS